MSNETKESKFNSERKQTVRTPLYKQIRDYVLDNIQQMNWQPNEKIPSENELAAKFNVSRITIKNALLQLIEEGLIYRIQGKGTFISANKQGEPPVYRLLQQHDKTVAYLMPRLDNRFTANLLNGIENQLAEEGYHLLFCETHDSQEKENEILKRMIRFGVAGLIIYPAHSQTYNEEILKITLNEFPVVVVDRYLRGVETNYVCSDNVKGSFDATAHLIQSGHRRIGFVSTHAHGTTSIEDRLTGYEKALSEHNILIDRHLRMLNLDSKQVNTILQNGAGHPDSKEQIKHYLEQNSDLTAVIAVNSTVGLTLMEAAKEMPISIPEDLSIVFLDDYELSAFSTVPPTCVSLEEYTVGREAVKLLVSIIENPQQKRRKIIVPTRLTVRNSSAPPGAGKQIAATLLN
ncbi:GntR family transcriptional regulator [Paenibacillus filicis]|uniref:GntR family transcriptional regulator n=1 Tax=Paenibacillus gyeongsangnamensis TaxID=3388067 RepID=A0ABT4Q436_9BACL|nr:GntR family transcriptional regulator [Paenibacillus filicis]MCZ8511643.1 GntR family transcriptional regulator [Paenibacillus filicis]